MIDTGFVVHNVLVHYLVGNAVCKRSVGTFSNEEKARKLRTAIQQAVTQYAKASANPDFDEPEYWFESHPLADVPEASGLDLLSIERASVEQLWVQCASAPSIKERSN